MNLRSSNAKQNTDNETHLGVSQVVDSDSKEHVQQRVVSKQHEDDKVQRVDHAPLDAALRLDAIVHHFVPIFTC